MKRFTAKPQHADADPLASWDSPMLNWSEFFRSPLEVAGFRAMMIAGLQDLARLTKRKRGRSRGGRLGSRPLSESTIRD